jgi:hypothetical protein
VFVVIITRRVRITPRAAGAGDSAGTVLSTMWSVGATWTATEICGKCSPDPERALRGAGEAHPDGLPAKYPLVTERRSGPGLTLEERCALAASEHRGLAEVVVCLVVEPGRTFAAGYFIKIHDRPDMSESRLARAADEPWRRDGHPEVAAA